MSVHAMAWAWQAPGLTSNEVLVLVALADHASDTGRAWPAMSTIARKSRLHRATVFRILRRLEQQGLITPVSTRGGRSSTTGQGRTNVYQLNLTGPRYPVELTENQQTSTDPELTGNEGSHSATLPSEALPLVASDATSPLVAPRDRLSQAMQQDLVASYATQSITEPSITIRDARSVGAHGETVEHVTLADGSRIEIPPQPKPTPKLTDEQRQIALNGVRQIRAQLNSHRSGSNDEAGS